MKNEKCYFDPVWKERFHKSEEKLKTCFKTVLEALLSLKEVGYEPTIYLAPAEDDSGDRPCHICRRMCINAGIKDCYYIDNEGRMTHEESGWWVSLEDEWIKERILMG